LNQALPFGPGISIQSEFHEDLLEYLADRSTPKTIKWFEIVPENYMGRGGYRRHVLMEVAKKLPISLHSVSLSIGSIDPLNEEYLNQVVEFAHEINAVWYTDHLSFSSAKGTEFYNLLPLPFTWETVEHVVKRIKKVQSMMEIPFGIENPSYYAQYTGNELTEAQFISEILERSNCKLLLDINNVFVNSMNHFGKADDQNVELAIEKSREFLNHIPLDRVIEVHIAGHKKVKVRDESVLLDNHGAPVPKPVQILLQNLNRLQPVERLMLEREANVPPFATVVEEVNQLWGLISTQPFQSREMQT
jgi:uncharacterized protein (UPF0276 family)